MNNLITMTTASKLLNLDFSYLQHYKRKGRFVKATFIDGKPFYDREEVLKWTPKYERIGRPVGKR